MSERITQPEFKPTDEQLSEIHRVYSEVVSTQAPLLDRLKTTPNRDNISTRDLSTRKDVKIIDPSEVEGHDQALSYINGIIIKIDKGGFDIRDLPKSLQLHTSRDNFSAKEIISRQKDHLQDVANVIDARLQKRERDGGFFDGMKAHNEALNSHQKAKTAHHRRVEKAISKEVSAKKRELVKKEMGRLALIHGQINLDRDPELLREAQKEARNNVERKLAKDRELLELIKSESRNKVLERLGKGPIEPNYYDTDNPGSKEERIRREDEMSKRAEERKKLVNNFGAGISPTTTDEDINTRDQSTTENEPSRSVVSLNDQYRKIREDYKSAKISQDPHELVKKYFINNTNSSVAQSRSPLKGKIMDLFRKQPAVRFDGKDSVGNIVNPIGSSLISREVNKNNKVPRRLAIALGSLAMISGIYGMTRNPSASQIESLARFGYSPTNATPLVGDRLSGAGDVLHATAQSVEKSINK